MRVILIAVGLWAIAAVAWARSPTLSDILIDAPTVAIDINKASSAAIGTDDPFSMSEYEIRDEYRLAYCYRKIDDAAIDLSDFSIGLIEDDAIDGISPDLGEIRRQVQETTRHLEAANAAAEHARSLCRDNAHLLIKADELSDLVETARQRRDRFAAAALGVGQSQR